MKHRIEQLSPYLFAAALLLCACISRAQVPVAMAPPIHFQFFASNGQPLSNGKVYTYAAGTTTLLNTYVDSTGNAQNPDPILLDSSGSPSNGSVQTGIFLANNSYKFVGFDRNNVQQWSVDGVSSYFGLLNSNNTWSASNTFSAAIVDTLTDNQIVLGALTNQITLDFPPPSGNVTLHFPNTSQNVIGNLSPSITSPIVNGVQVCGSPGTYESYNNYPTTGTTLNSLVALHAGGANAIIPNAGQSSGVLGIACSGAGITGAVTVQESGRSSCNFDGSVTSNDYVQISTSVAGDCTDAGPNYPTSGQVIGRVLANNSGAGLYLLDLFAPEIQAQSNLGLATATCAALSGAGVGATISCTGARDAGGFISLTTAGTPGTGAPLWNVSFGASHAGANCTISPANVNAIAASVWNNSVSTTTLLIDINTPALSSGQTYNWQYTCTFR